MQSTTDPTAYKRLQHRASMLETPRIAAVQRLAEQTQQRASSEASARAIESARRAEIRDDFTTATEKWVSAVSAGGKAMSGVRRAKAAAVTELCAAVDKAMSLVSVARCLWSLSAGLYDAPVCDLQIT